MAASKDLRTQTALAKKSGVAQSTIGRILRGEVNPQSGILARLAKALGMPLDQLARMAQGEEMGKRLTDRPDSVPLISWVQAGAFEESVDNYPAGEGEDRLNCPRPCGPNTFALRVIGESMAPVYQEGDIIFVDPAVVPRHGKDVVMRSNDRNEATLKRLVVEGKHRYLKPLNPHWPQQIIDIPADAQIVGVVLGKWVDS